MSKKDKKIKLLKKELKDLKAEVRKLKLASLSRTRNEMTKALGRLPKPPPASKLTAIEKSPDISAETVKKSRPASSGSSKAPLGRTL